MARRLVLVALGAAAAAAVLASRRRLPFGNPQGNGGARARGADLRRRIEEARERLRADIERAREE